jgi:HSP20 family protein
MFYFQFPSFTKSFENFFNYNTTEEVDTDLKETEKELTLKTVLAGFSKEEVTISINKSTLKITAKHTKKDTWLKEEYNKSYIIPEKVDTDKISVTLENGILTIILPYQEKEQSKTITIK